jgi:FkbM family methyltransferase
VRALTRFGYSLYRRSPLHPHLGGLIKRGFQLRNRLVAREPFVHDLGEFRMNIDLRELIDTSIHSMGTWEATSISTIGRLLPPGGTAVDVGANIGFMTLHMAARVGRQGRVFAFEPNTWAFERLQANLALNDMPQVVVERAGLGDREEVQTDVMVPYSYPLVGERPWMRDTIVIRRLDEYFEKNPIDRLDLVKCDTDGWEVHVFEGAAETLRRFRPSILLEINPCGLEERGQSVAGLIGWLRDLGYAIHHEESLEAFPDVEAVAARLARTKHDMDVVALHSAPRAVSQTQA